MLHNRKMADFPPPLGRPWSSGVGATDGRPPPPHVASRGGNVPGSSRRPGPWWRRTRDAGPRRTRPRGTVTSSSTGSETSRWPTTRGRRSCSAQWGGSRHASGMTWSCPGRTIGGGATSGTTGMVSGLPHRNQWGAEKPRPAHMTSQGAHSPVAQTPQRNARSGGDGGNVKGSSSRRHHYLWRTAGARYIGCGASL